jgi:dTDP-4-dehydrorhamnose 3,5-epimerase
MTEFEDGAIDGVEVRRLLRHTDPRGWLCELYRSDEAPPGAFAAMAYISLSRAGVARGPHEHLDQSDWLCFVGPSDFELVLWDNRAASRTYRRRTSLVVGEGAPSAVLIPSGVVHGYRNVGRCDGLVLNFPNRLYRGEGHAGRVDEIRHEADDKSPFRL